jgi:hypothetical protein
MTDEDIRPPGRMENSFHGHDPRVVEVSNPVELEYWVKFLMTTEHELRAAISAVGHSAQRVRERLGYMSVDDGEARTRDV